MCREPPARRAVTGARGRRCARHVLALRGLSAGRGEQTGRQAGEPRAPGEARRSQSDPVLIRNRQLCSKCREIKMVQPRTVAIPDDLQLSFENLLSHKMMSLQPPRDQTVPNCPQDDILTESVRYRLPILGPRTAVFHGLLSQTYRALQKTQLPPSPGKEPAGKVTSLRVMRAQHS